MLNITSSILCGFILFWYGEEGVAVYMVRFALRRNADGFYYFSDDSDEDTNLSNLTTISVMALIELFLSILGALAFQERSSHTQVNSFAHQLIHSLRVRVLHLTRSGSQLQRRILFILPTHKIAI